MSEWFLVLSEQSAGTPLSNWLVFLLVAGHVVWARTLNVRLYPAGIATLAIVCYNSFVSNDWANLAFSVYFLVMLCHGWAYWTAQKGTQGGSVSYASTSDWRTAFAIVGAVFVMLYLIRALVMDADFPFWESGVGAVACGCVWLLNHRKIEYWVLLNMSQAFAIPLLVHTDQVLYALLSLFLYIFSIFGFFSWRRIILQQRKFVHA